MKKSGVSRIVVLGSYVPRQCGIATFTCDLLHAMAAHGHHVEAIAVEDHYGAYQYPLEVTYKIRQHELAEYIGAASWIDRRNFDYVSVQHEFGIYGGQSGSYLLELLKRVNMPIVPTLHTILEEPSADQRRVFEELMDLSDKVVCMSKKGAQLLETVYGVDSAKVEVIPHGIPSVDIKSVYRAKASLGYRDERVLFTFGLLSPDKGVEDVISAMPDIVREHPNTVYSVVGATHPQIRAAHGESYRDSLVRLASDIGMADHVRFENNYVSLDELTTRLHACDIYITPYRKRQQITSGTLAYAYGCGNAVISTPYWHASELLAAGRGVLVPFNCPKSIAFESCRLLSDDHRLGQIQKAAFEAGKEMQWPEVGKRYAEAFRSIERRPASIVNLGDRIPLSEELVVEEAIPGLNYLVGLTDRVGILQHSTYGIPNRHEGYCLDDCSRAALVLSRVLTLQNTSDDVRRALDTNLAFIGHALDPTTRQFRNFMAFDGTWLGEPVSSDAIGRAVWSLGTIAAKDVSSNRRQYARAMLSASKHAMQSVTSLRGKALLILGLLECARADIREFESIRMSLVRELSDLWQAHADKEWPWIESVLLYDNALLPHALIAAGSHDADYELLDKGLVALDWLCDIQSTPIGTFRPIGSDSFYSRGCQRCNFDQQPLEAWTVIEACLAAYHATQDERWLVSGGSAYQWYHGRNDLEVSMVDPETGGCYDGLTPYGPNRNQGAEAVISLVGAKTALALANVSVPVYSATQSMTVFDVA
ncbi:MAG: D-inositol-3-phosphate glycosyltransferase [Fimbriimonadaceae bacterium]|nr:D-inositol-3-phosphate glycosyltransferase [Fimbriimonadaceae bacterium]